MKLTKGKGSPRTGGCAVEDALSGVVYRDYDSPARVEVTVGEIG